MRELGVPQAFFSAPDSVNDIVEVPAVPEFPCRYRPQGPVVSDGANAVENHRIESRRRNLRLHLKKPL
jgi:hypothetical protein